MAQFIWPWKPSSAYAAAQQLSAGVKNPPLGHSTARELFTHADPKANIRKMAKWRGEIKHWFVRAIT